MTVPLPEEPDPEPAGEPEHAAVMTRSAAPTAGTATRLKCFMRLPFYCVCVYDAFAAIGVRPHLRRESCWLALLAKAQAARSVENSCLLDIKGEIDR